MQRILVTSAWVAAALGALPAVAAQRTFVASTGVDTNPCSLAKPCRGFAAAILLTDPNGEVVVLDSAGYGPVTVTKAVSIVAPPGVYAGISVFAGQDGVTVIAGATDKVALRGLSINGQGGNNGIVVAGGGQVHIEHCEVANLGIDGVVVAGASAVHIANSTVRSNGARGIHSLASAGEVYVNETRVAHNAAQGILAEAGVLSVNRTVSEGNGSSGLLVNPGSPSTVSAVVRGSVAVGNAGSGIVAITDAIGEIANLAVDDSGAMRNGFTGFAANSNSLGTATLVLSQSSSTYNQSIGVFASGTGATAYVSSSTVSRNVGTGLLLMNSSAFHSHGNNAVNGNGGGDKVGAIVNDGTL